MASCCEAGPLVGCTNSRGTEPRRVVSKSELVKTGLYGLSLGGKVSQQQHGRVVGVCVFAPNGSGCVRGCH
jgi:hypothetical protein